MGLGAAQALEERDETERIQSGMADGIESRQWRRESADTPSTPSPIPSSTPEPIVAPTLEPVLDEPPEPTPDVQQTEVPSVSGAAGSIEQAICAYPWECGIALRVAACESGPDYTAGFNGSGHAGTFQVSPIHAWRFSARGLDFWTDALDLEWNLDVAYEIWTERWWYAWSCF